MPKTIKIDSIHHTDDKRPNIPTIQQQNYVPDDEKTAQMVLYSRNTDLDPQLVWRGKDEQDSADLEVATVPIYTQEKIEPQCIIENLRENNGSNTQLDLFGDYDGIDWEKSLDFYQHEQNWQNRIVLGDSLLVMNSLAEKENLKGKVQMIYLDPPYGIKFGSNWQVSTRNALTDKFTIDATKQMQWRAFLRKNRLDTIIDLAAIAQEIENFLMPVVLTINEGKQFTKTWIVGAGWNT